MSLVHKKRERERIYTLDSDTVFLLVKHKILQDNSNYYLTGKGGGGEADWIILMIFFYIFNGILFMADTQVFFFQGFFFFCAFLIFFFRASMSTLESVFCTLAAGADSGGAINA